MLNLKGLKIKFYSHGTDDSENLTHESLLTTDDNNVKLSTLTVLHIKLWLKEDNDLHTDNLRLLFKFIIRRHKIYEKRCLLLAIISYAR